MIRTARAADCVWTLAPRDIIELDHDTITAKGYHPAKLVDEEKCTGCTSCAIMCPDAAITVER